MSIFNIFTHSAYNNNSYFSFHFYFRSKKKKKKKYKTDSSHNILLLPDVFAIIFICYTSHFCQDGGVSKHGTHFPPQSHQSYN